MKAVVEESGDSGAAEKTPRSGRRAAATPKPKPARMPQPKLDDSESSPGFFNGLHFVLTSANRRPKGALSTDHWGAQESCRRSGGG